MSKSCPLSMRGALRLAAMVVAGWPLAAVQAAETDKRGYTWTRPVPREMLREMTTDRPDATESPFTVDAGHVQLEMDFANYGRDRAGGVRTAEWEVAPFNLRFGISENFEAGVFVVPYRMERETAGGGRVRRSGFGDMTLRAKWNFRGNDGGDVAVGLMADLKLPTGDGDLSNDEFEGALTLPVAFTIGGGWEGAAMTSVEVVYTDAGRHRAVWSNTITAGRDLTENVGGFVELTSSTGDGSHVATFNAGVTRRFGTEIQWDAGVNIGLSEAAPDLVVFSGISRRF